MTALQEGGMLDNPKNVRVGGCHLGSAHNFSGNFYLKVHINPNLTREIGASSKSVFISFHSVSRQEPIVVSKYIDSMKKYVDSVCPLQINFNTTKHVYTADYADC